ncbi:pyruvate dehydrogenase E1 component beta subunit [Sinosporangium album]|uniref:Pyruvate dehydrogenase E1 component subunit beta n=1 Tax=Sinosporangium album TaxID=504805 RepID=A0A1G7S1L9_9ACTN|nr:transketolase C-terminal domain-containing protein [Sinosporangium album]SDG16000.1 pyruvate dehydrogenase E1 component beta subunit [Sinosporangium album]
MRVADNLNAALHDLLEHEGDVYLLGEDVADPYGGAFKITRGLSSKFPGRVLTTPISEGGIAGVAAGLALTGDKAIVEIMFGDFVALAFDQILNFASKSVAMYGRPLPLRMVVRCPSGGGRGYGPTHSQSPHKHFLGIPGLSLYEVTPFHDNRAVLREMFARQEPCILFEDKILYTRQMYDAGDLFTWDMDGDVARVYLDDPTSADCVIIAPGGLAHRALAAMRTLLLEREITCLLLVPSRLYPLDLDPVLPHAERAKAVVVCEDGPGGAGWGSEVAHLLHTRLWGRLTRPVAIVHARNSVIPAAPHLEKEVLVQESTICRAVLEVLGG